MNNVCISATVAILFVRYSESKTSSCEQNSEPTFLLHRILDLHISCFCHHHCCRFGFGFHFGAGLSFGGEELNPCGQILYALNLLPKTSYAGVEVQSIVAEDLIHLGYGAVSQQNWIHIFLKNRTFL